MFHVDLYTTGFFFDSRLDVCVMCEALTIVRLFQVLEIPRRHTKATRTFSFYPPKVILNTSVHFVESRFRKYELSRTSSEFTTPAAHSSTTCPISIMANCRFVCRRIRHRYVFLLVFCCQPENTSFKNIHTPVAVAPGLFWGSARNRSVNVKVVHTKLKFAWKT